MDEKNKRKSGHLDSYVDCHCLGMDEKLLDSDVDCYCLGVEEKNKLKCEHLDSDISCYCLGMDEKNKRKCGHLPGMLTVIV
jgi:hypothetical protein